MSLWSIVAETWRDTPAPVKTIVTAAFGTLIGAWLTGRAQAKRRLIDELKAVRAARALCVSISNRALALKRQHLLPMKTKHNEAVAAFQAHERGELHVALDLETLSQLKFPDDALERIVFEKCAIGEMGLAAVVSLSGAIDDLRNAINFRNELIAHCRENISKLTELEKIQMYVGAPKNGEIDNRFRHNVQALAAKADDCVFFSMLLTKELEKYANALHCRNRFRFRLGMARLQPVDWSVAQRANLVPPESDYADWLRGFKHDPSRWDLLKFTRIFQKADESERPKDKVAPTTFENFGRTGYRKRSKGPHSTFIDHTKR
jgi:hypothetical protein